MTAFLIGLWLICGMLSAALSRSRRRSGAGWSFLRLLTSMLDAIKAAKSAGATSEQLAPAFALQRKAQWRLDFVNAENSMGFHAPQETARILAEAIDYARQGEAAAVRAGR